MVISMVLRQDGSAASQSAADGSALQKEKIDPRTPLRDSGIPWLGEIPAHWETPPVYSRFEVQLGKMLDEKKSKELIWLPI